MIRVGFLLLALLSVSLCKVSHFRDNNFHAKTNQTPYTLVYFYSSDCGYCKEFTPKFEKLSNNQSWVEKGVSFGKMDAVTYQDLARSYSVYSYPSVLLFFKGISAPVSYYRERAVEPISEFLSQMLEPSNDQRVLQIIHQLSNDQKITERAVLFYGQKDSLEFRMWDVLAKRDGFIHWGLVESQEPRVEIGQSTIYLNQTFQEVEGAVEAAFARLHDITEFAWLRMVEKKKFTIAYINSNNNKKTRALVAELAKEEPTVHFIEVNGQSDQYGEALGSIGIHDEENIVAVDKLYSAVYVAQSPYTKESLKEFIKKAKAHELDLYMKTEKTEKPNKLTRANFEQKMGTKQDVLLFLYNRKEKISKQLMKLFEFLVYHLKDNKNLLLLRCDVGLNDIEAKLEVSTKNTPKVLFYRNRMKDRPIHFAGSTISDDTMIEFIMENTTFDFEEEWEL